MSDIVPFDFEGASVRVVTGATGDPWFVAVDVCRVLEQGNPRQVLSRLDADEKGVRNMDTPGGRQDMAIINESGLYSLILTSRKPSAKKFKRWVTAEVLPRIRRTGGYGAPVPNPAAVARLVEAARKINRNSAVDVLRAYLPAVSIGGHEIRVFPGRAAPDPVTAAVMARLQQPDLPPLDRARAYRRLHQSGWRPREIGAVVGRTPRHVEIDLRMVERLSPAVQEAMDQGRIRTAHARPLMAVPHAAQDLALRLILKGTPCWRTEREIRASLGKLRDRKATPAALPAPAPAPAPASGPSCLRHLLEWRVDDVAVGELVVASKVSEAACSLLSTMGLRVDVEDWDGWIVIADSHPALAARFNRTAWASGWRETLLTVSGARATEVVRFRRHKVTAVAIPLRAIDS